MNIFTNTQEAISYIVESNEIGESAEIKTTAQVACEILNSNKLGKFELNVNEDKIKNSSSSLDKSLFILRNAHDSVVAEDACSLIANLTFEEYVSFGGDSINDLILNNKASEEIENGMFMMSSVATVMYTLAEKLKKQKELVKKYISTSNKFEVLYNNIDEDLFKQIENRSNIVFVLAHPMGFGKTTKVTKRLFDEYSKKDNGYAIGISPKRILTSMICDDERNYKKINVKSSVGGVFGVINSIVMNHSFEKIRSNANIIIAEEHEEIIAQATGRAVGDGSLLARAELLEGYMSLIRSTNKVVLMDAMFSEESAKMIEKETGKKVVIVKSAKEIKNNVTVRIMNETTNVAIANNAARSNKNVLGFSDAKNKGDNSELSALYNSIAKDAKSAQLITANTISELRDEVSYIKDIQNVIASKQVTILSPIINSGVSIVNGHADSVHVFANQVISLKSAIQTIKRDRKAEVVNLSINIAKSRPNTSRTIVLADEVMRDAKVGGISEETFNAYRKNKSVNEVIDAMILENKIKNNYKVNMIIALRMLGFNVEFFKDEDLQEDGKEAKRAGREIEEQERIENLLNADKISEKQAIKLSKENYITNNQRFEIARFEIESTYQESISEDLIEFDNKGSMRRKFENNLIASNMHSSYREISDFKQQVVFELFSILNINSKMLKGEFSKNDADLFVDKIKNGTFEKDGIKLTGSEAFKIVFKENLYKGHSTSVVSKFLKSKFGIETTKTGQKTINGIRVNMYRIDKEAMNEQLVLKLEKIYKA